MNPWTALVNLIVRAIDGSADLLGGSPALGVFVLVLVARLALVPILLPLARRTKAWRAVFRAIRPEARALQKELKDDPVKMQKALNALHARHGIRVLDTAGLLLALIQVPVLIAFFQAVIHYSAGTPLATGGLPYGIAAGVLSYAGTVLGDATTAKPLLWMAGVLPVVIAVWLGSGVGLYLVAFYLGTLVQSLLVRRGETAVATG